jgi:hypothetical protein
MKKFRFVLPMIALVLAVATSAFTSEKQHASSTTGLWYRFVGTDQDDPLDYELLDDGTVAPECNAETSIRCAVQAPANPEHGSDYPDLEAQGVVIRNKVQ